MGPGETLIDRLKIVGAVSNAVSFDLHITFVSIMKLHLTFLQSDLSKRFLGFATLEFLCVVSTLGCWNRAMYHRQIVTRSL